LKVALVGDLHHGRTVHSLLKLLRLYKAQIYLVSPPGFEMPSDLMISQDKCLINLIDCIGEVDVVYMTRVQKERIINTHLLDSIYNYSITPQIMQQALPNMILMHPLPRVDELPVSLDRDPRAKYFEQIGNGLLIRQAIFYNLFGLGKPYWNNFEK
jgi:aspartate carbamoyltransferase catalytic subunit